MKSVRKKSKEEQEAVKRTIRIVKKEMDTIQHILEKAEIPLEVRYLSDKKGYKEDL